MAEPTPREVWKELYRSVRTGSSHPSTQTDANLVLRNRSLRPEQAQAPQEFRQLGRAELGISPVGRGSWDNATVISAPNMRARSPQDTPEELRGGYASTAIRPLWETKDPDPIMDDAMELQNSRFGNRWMATARSDAKALALELHSHVNHVIESRRRRDVYGGGDLWRQDVIHPRVRELRVPDSSSPRLRYKIIKRDEYATHEDYADALSGAATALHEYLSTSPSHPYLDGVHHLFNSMGNKLEQAVGILRDAHRAEMTSRPISSNREISDRVQVLRNDSDFLSNPPQDRYHIKAHSNPEFIPVPGITKASQILPGSAYNNPAYWVKGYPLENTGRFIDDLARTLEKNPNIPLPQDGTNLVFDKDAMNTSDTGETSAAWAATTGSPDNGDVTNWMVVDPSKPRIARTGIHELAHLVGHDGNRKVDGDYTFPHLQAFMDPLKRMHPIYSTMVHPYRRGLEEGYADAVATHFVGGEPSKYPNAARVRLSATSEGFDPYAPSRVPRLLCSAPDGNGGVCGFDLLGDHSEDHEGHFNSPDGTGSISSHQEHIHNLLWAYGYHQGAGSMNDEFGNRDEFTTSMLPTVEDLHGMSSPYHRHNPYDRIADLNEVHPHGPTTDFLNDLESTYREEEPKEALSNSDAFNRISSQFQRFLRPGG